MKKAYYEVVVEAPESLIKGFIEGYLMGRGCRGTVFYSREHHIRCESLAELVKEWIGMRNLTHLVVDDKSLKIIKDGFKRSKGDLVNSLKSVRKISSASFQFSFHVYAPYYATKIKAMLKKLPDGVRLKRGYKFREKIIPEARGAEGYAPEHDYEASGSGTIVGDLHGVLRVHEKMLKHELIEVKDIVLRFAGRARK